MLDMMPLLTDMTEKLSLDLLPILCDTSLSIPTCHTTLVAICDFPMNDVFGSFVPLFRKSETWPPKKWDIEIARQSGQWGRTGRQAGPAGAEPSPNVLVFLSLFKLFTVDHVWHPRLDTSLPSLGIRSW